MNENLFSKDEPSVNEHHYNIAKKQYNEEAHNIYNIDKSKIFNIKKHRYTGDHYYNKKQFMNKNIINNITKNTINNTEHILNVKEDFSTNKYISNNYKSQIDYIGNNLYKNRDNIIFNNTNNITKHINNYSNEVTNNYKINKIQNLNKTYYNSQHDAFINKHNTINANDTYNITKNNSLCNVTDNQYFTKKNFNTSNITNNITRHDHNNYEHNVIKKVYTHIQHINNYGTEINYYNEK